MPCHLEGMERRERGSSGRSCSLDICCDLTCSAVGRVAWQYLRTYLLSLKHSQKQLATGASSWGADHRKQLATTNSSSFAQMTPQQGYVSSASTLASAQCWWARERILLEVCAKPCLTVDFTSVDHQTMCRASLQLVCPASGCLE